MLCSVFSTHRIGSVSGHSTCARRSLVQKSQTRRLTRSAAIRHSAFSSDGELIAIAGDDAFIFIVRCLIYT